MTYISKKRLFTKTFSISNYLNINNLSQNTFYLVFAKTFSKNIKKNRVFLIYTF